MLVSDFYAAYTSYDGRHQYCWAHLLRDVDELVDQHPADAAVRGWADGVHAPLPAGPALRSRPIPAARRQQRQGCEADAGALCPPYLRRGAQAPQRVLCRRIDQAPAELFVFVEDPAVPADQQRRRASLRHWSSAARSAAAPAPRTARPPG